jgi:hypothetical protein
MEKELTTFFKLIVLSVVLLCITRCDDIIEKDLSKKTVTLTAPSDGVSTTYASQNFVWETVNGATDYRLQIATPTFDNIEKLLVDAVMDTNVYSYTLSPGKYQWRVCAYNGSTETSYSVHSLTIKDTSDISSQTIVPVGPADNYISSKSAVQFSWQNLYNATSYQLQIKKTSDASVLYPNVFTTYDTLTQSVPEGSYQWSVRGYNSTTKTYTTYSVSRSLVIDQTAPGLPTLKSPANQSTQTSNLINFQWTKPTDNLTQVTDSLLVASDSLFTNLTVAIKTGISASSYSHTFTSAGKYYWKVKSTDQAGNQGQYSNKWYFTIQP